MSRQFRNAFVTLVVICLAALVVRILLLPSGPPREPSDKPLVTVTSKHRPLRPAKRKNPDVGVREVTVWKTNTEPGFLTNVRPSPSAVTANPMQTNQAGSTTHARELLTRLSQVDLNRGTLTQGQTDEINMLLKQLVGEGPAAIPAIREFLEQHAGQSFDAAGGANLADYRTLRLDLIDALQQIGSPEATQLSASTLQSTIDPMEIALLSRYLEQQVPGQYRQIELAAAREALAQTTGAQVQLGDVSALFELLQAYGDASVVPDLEKAVAQWNYYATLALAGLPNGAGIPTLIKLAQDPAVSSLGMGDFALRPLAQVALESSDAAHALLDIARQNRVPDSAWPTVAASLGGNYIQYGNQLFGSTSPALNWSLDQLNQHVALVNQLLAVTTSPIGRQALQGALVSISARFPK